jgi:hypothetical protein
VDEWPALSGRRTPRTARAFTRPAWCEVWLR